ncbi:MAG: hypothetical protein ABW046_22505 [Actinoplanes sp.]
MGLILPRLPPEAMKTYAIAEPLPTHYRPVPCGQVEGGCTAFERGWRTACDLTTQLGLDQARYIRDKAGRKFTHTMSGDGKLVTFQFPAGQQCFAGHRVSLGRPALFVVRNGDRRGSGRRPLQRRVFDRPDQWVDDLHEATDRMVEASQRG